MLRSWLLIFSTTDRHALNVGITMGPLAFHYAFIFKLLGTIPLLPDLREEVSPWVLFW
jgi:hypothetical protein